MGRVTVTSDEYASKTPRQKVTAANNTAIGIGSATGYFPDGTATETNLRNAATALRSKLDAFDAIPSDTNRSLAHDAEKDCDVMMNNAIIYTQGKCNAAPDAEIAAAMAHAAALDIKSKKSKHPVPGPVTAAEAEYTSIPNTVLVRVKRRPRYTKYFEVYISTNPDDESGWKLWDTFSCKELLIKRLESGEKYFIRVLACNNTGKGLPGNALEQRAA